jgi:hypothetical protein
MAFRRPLKRDGGNLKEMSDSEIADIKTAMYWQYITSPSVTLTVVGSGGNLGNITDTRLIAGAYSTSVSAYPAETTTAEPATVEVVYARVNQTVSTVTLTSNPSNILYPAYYTVDGNIQSMSLQDMYDTFGYDVIDLLIASDDIYSISSSTTKSGYTRLSTTPIFSDSGTDASLYTGTTIPISNDGKALEDPLAEFWLFKRNASATGFVSPAYIHSGTNIRSYTDQAFADITSNMIRYIASAVTGYRIRYSWNGSGNNSGVVTDQRLNGSGNYQTKFVNADDYRAQEWPNGSHAIANTYTLKVRKE